MLHIPFRISNRFGEPLSAAILEVRLPFGVEPERTFQSNSNSDGRGKLLVAEYNGIGPAKIRFFVHWMDPDGVYWGFQGESAITPIFVGLTGDQIVEPEQGFTITTRMFPQALPLPEIGHVTRGTIRGTREGIQLHLAYEESRDAMLAGLPNASAVMSGKALETAILLRGAQKGWPLKAWSEKRYTLGDLLSAPEVKEDIERSFNSGFYQLLRATNVPRVLAAHQKGTRLHMDESKAVLRSLTQLIDGWFGEPAPGR